jgi:folate-dependent phosphoribosylglycinamide formyltransferase PurN
LIVGLTSAARVNPYATLLIDELQRRQLAVGFVLTTQRGYAGDLWERLKRRGLAGTLRALRRRAGRDTPGPRPLAAWAAQRELDLSLPLARICERAGIELLPVKSLSAAAAAEAVRDRGTEVLINAGGGLFRKRLLEAPSRGLLNAHMARLPDLRGVDVLEWSVLLGVQPGVTVHWIDSGVDTGPILGFEPLSPAPDDTLESLRERAVLLSATAVADQVARLARGEAEEMPETGETGNQYFVLHARLRERAAVRLAARSD